MRLENEIPPLVANAQEIIALLRQEYPQLPLGRGSYAIEKSYLAWAPRPSVARPERCAAPLRYWPPRWGHRGIAPPPRCRDVLPR